MNQLRRAWIWLSRIGNCRGFGIQSPTDYAFVRYVVNEHWPYYAYEELQTSDWLERKKGRLFLRLANWRQPQRMFADEWRPWWHAGSQKIQFVDSISSLCQVELARVTIDDADGWQQVLERCGEQSVVVVDEIYRDWARWHAIEQDGHVGTTFDLYYCGVVFFDCKRYKHHYRVNF